MREVPVRARKLPTSGTRKVEFRVILVTGDREQANSQWPYEVTAQHRAASLRAAGQNAQVTEVTVAWR